MVGRTAGITALVVLGGVLASNTEAADRCGVCAPQKKYVERYAVLYIATQPAGAIVTSTLDGQTFSDGTGTPTEVIFVKSKFPFGDQPVGLISYKDCYRPSFDRVTVNRWYRSQQEAKTNPHQIRPQLVPLANCTP